MYARSLPFSPFRRTHVRASFRALYDSLRICRSVSHCRPALSTKAIHLHSLPAATAACNLIRRRFIAGSLHRAKSALTAVQVIRLLILCLIMGIWPPIAISLSIYYSIVVAQFPWPGWAVVHAHFPRVLSLPAAVQPIGVHRLALQQFWLVTGSTYLITIIFMCGEDVRGDIVKAWNWVLRKPSSPSSPFSSRERSPSGSQSLSSPLPPSEWIE